MARTSTKPKNTEEIKEEVVVNNVQLEQKNKEIEELKAMVMQMQNAMLNMQTAQPVATQTQQDEFTSIYKYIPVVSLFDGMLNLSTGQGGAMGQGKVYTFTKFGETRNIVYNDLREIVSSSFQFASQGYFYIADAKVVDECGLTQVYETLLSKEKIENILDESTDYIADIYTSVPEAQKQAVVDYLVKNLAEGKTYDLNKIDVISRIYGKNLIEMGKDLSFAMSQKGK